MSWAADGRDKLYAASIAPTSSFGRNGFCRHTTLESSGGAERKSSVVIPDIATMGKSGMRSRIIVMTSKPFIPCRKISTITRSNREFSNSLLLGFYVKMRLLCLAAPPGPGLPCQLQAHYACTASGIKKYVTLG